MSSKLRGTVREKKVTALDDTFPKIGTAEAGQKSRHGDVPLNNIAHTKVSVTMADYYSGELIDNLDTLKTNIDERQVTVQAISGALGRRTDTSITDAMDLATNTVAAGSTGLTKAKVQGVQTRFGNREVPDDGQRYWAVSPAGWVDLVDITEFSDADFIGPDQLPWPTGITAKRWFGFLFFSFSGLPGVVGGDRKTFAYHRNAIGLGMNAEPKVSPDWENLKQAWSFVGSISLGAVIIDNDGIEEVSFAE